MQKIFLKLCEPCEVAVNDLHSTHAVDTYAKTCRECQAKIMQCVRLLVSKNLQPVAVVVEMVEIPDAKDLGRWGRADLLELIEKLR